MANVFQAVPDPSYPYSKIEGSLNAKITLLRVGKSSCVFQCVNALLFEEQTTMGATHVIIMVSIR